MITFVTGFTDPDVARVTQPLFEPRLLPPLDGLEACKAPFFEL